MSTFGDHRCRTSEIAHNYYGETDEETRFGAGYARPRMWAQYAGNHTGACIVVDRRELLARFNERFPGTTNLPVPAPSRRLPFPPFTSDDVEYKRREGATSVDFEKLRMMTPGEAVEDYFAVHWRQAFFLKHEDWRDEREFRLCVYQRDQPGPCYVELDGAVAGLVLGVDFAGEHLAVAKAFSDDLKVRGRVARIEWDRLDHQLFPVGVGGP